MKKALAPEQRTPKPDLFVRLLAGESDFDVITSVYYMGRLLQRRRDLDDVYQGFRAPNVASEPNDYQQDLTFAILRRIEQIEETPIRDLTDAQAAKYIFRLGRILRERARPEGGYDPKRGKELLTALRAQYK